MKIGILTFHAVINYGAVLQAYGLQTFLARMGHEVEIINFMPDEVYAYYDYHIFSKPLSLRSVVAKTLRRQRAEIEFKAFEDFRGNWLSLTRRCNTTTELAAVCSYFDAVICGSDQIWNPMANGNRMNDYYLGTVPHSVRKIAYAASFGNVKVIDGREDEVAKLLTSFMGISVREEEAVAKIACLSDVPVQRVIDPSMLLSREDYRRVELRSSSKGGYILTYKLNENKSMDAAVARASKFLGLPIVSLGRKLSKSTFKKDIGPGEFLGLYADATCVITNSFHGTAFSLLYGKPFLTFGNGAYNSRMETLLGIAQQEERLCADCPSVEKIESLLRVSPTPDFETLVGPERVRAAKFLHDALDGE